MGAIRISYPSTMNVLGSWPQLSVAKKKVISPISDREMPTNIPEPKACQLLWLQPWFSTWDWVPVVTFLTLTLSGTRGWSPNLSLEERSLMGDSAEVLSGRLVRQAHPKRGGYQLPRKQLDHVCRSEGASQIRSQLWVKSTPFICVQRPLLPAHLGGGREGSSGGREAGLDPQHSSRVTTRWSQTATSSASLSPSLLGPAPLDTQKMCSTMSGSKMSAG